MFERVFDRLVKESRAVTAQAEEEARSRASGTVEAEHLLLALSRGDAGVAATELGRAGLDHGGVEEALERALEYSLAGVGVSAEPYAFPSPAPLAGRPRWGASAKLALARSLEVAAERDERRLEPAHILLALLRAEVGTVPRALAAAGVELADLVAETEAALDRAQG